MGFCFLECDRRADILLKGCYSAATPVCKASFTNTLITTTFSIWINQLKMKIKAGIQEELY